MRTVTYIRILNLTPMRLYSYIVVFSILSTLGCKTSSTSISILQPAQFKVGEHIQVVATVDRAVPAKGFNNVVEGLLTGEEIGADRNGRRVAIDALAETLTRTPRFTVRHTAMELTGSNSGDRITYALDWDQVDQICRQYGADALAVLESFDSDALVNCTSKVEKYTENKVEKTRTVWLATRAMNVTTGWRFYDPKNRIVLDEFLTNARNDFSNDSYKSEADAKLNLPNLTNCVGGVAKQAGFNYGTRIAPTWITVNRIFYVKVKNKSKDAEEMKKAGRLARDGNWEAALTLWKQLLDQPGVEKATKGKAAHNMAVATERLDKLKLAESYARAAYYDYGNKASRDYIQTLIARQQQQSRVNDQMGIKQQ